MTAANTNLTVADLNTITTLQDELKAKKKALRQAQERKEWEAKTKARNPQYVVGSLRKASAEEEAQLTHCHGEVCTILCEVCGRERVINKQDAFQVRFCKEHRKEASKTKAKAKRLEKKLGSVNPAELEAQIAALDEQLSDFGADSLANALID
jgi:hypothetical protein